MKRIFLPLILSLLLSSCGFHLRGMMDIPKWLNNVTILPQEANKEFAEQIKKQLEYYQIEVNPDPTTAQYWLMVQRAELQRRIVSVGSSTNPRQYQLVYIVEYILETSKGQVIKPLRQIAVSRQLTVNNDRILGSNAEEGTLITEMQRDAATQMINRLSRQE